MRYRILVFTMLASLIGFTPSVTFAAGDRCGCCADKVCPMDGTCCKHHGDQAAAAAEVLLPALDKPARQTAVVWFKNPVFVGEYILFGKYIIEHDERRMAKGLPCTHIYAESKPQLAVVKFHCVHLKGEPSTRDLVTLSRTGDPRLAKLSSFQFAGEMVAHGVPPVR